MALGDNNKKQNYENTFFSRLKFTNYEEKKMLSFSFWKGYLKVAINNMKESGTGVEYEELSAIHLSPIKAQILKEQLVGFRSLEDTATTNISVGIDTGIGETKNFLAVALRDNSSSAYMFFKC